MQTYTIDSPDGTSYKVEAENDQQAQAAIQSYLPSSTQAPEQSYLEKTAGNVVPDVKQTAENLANHVSGPAMDIMTGDVPAALPKLFSQGKEMLSHPKETAQAMARPFVHPIDYFQEHPVQQTMNVLSLLGGVKGLMKGEGVPQENTVGQRLAARTTSQALDISPLASRKLATKAGVSPEQAVLDLGNKANELIPNLIEPMDSANSKFTKVLDAHDSAGTKIGGIVKSVTKGTDGSLPEGQETIDALRNAADNYYQVDGGDVAIQKTADRLERLQKDGKLDFDRLSKVKSEIGKGFGKTDPPPGTEDIYDILNKNATKVVDRLSVEDPKLAPELAHLKEVYTVTSRLLPAMVRTAAKEVSGASVGSGILSKAIPSALGGMIGGPVGALAGAGAKYLQEAIAPDLTKNLAYAAMKATPEISRTLSKVPLAAGAKMAPDSDIVDLIQRLKQKYDSRRKM